MITSRKITDEMLARYILGESRPAECQIIEEQYLSDESVYQRLEAAEEEMFDAYACNELNPSQRKRFEERFLITQEGRERLAFARHLLHEFGIAQPPEQTLTRHNTLGDVALAAAIYGRNTSAPKVEVHRRGGGSSSS